MVEDRQRWGQKDAQCWLMSCCVLRNGVREAFSGVAGDFETAKASRCNEQRSRLGRVPRTGEWLLARPAALFPGRARILLPGHFVLTNWVFWI